MIVEETFAPEIDDVTNVNKASNVVETRLDSSAISTTQTGGENEHGNRKFDAEKVARIKAQLASGTYEINPSRIVSKMIENRT